MEYRFTNAAAVRDTLSVQSNPKSIILTCCGERIYSGNGVYLAALDCFMIPENIVPIKCKLCKTMLCKNLKGVSYIPNRLLLRTWAPQKDGVRRE